MIVLWCQLRRARCVDDPTAWLCCLPKTPEARERATDADLVRKPTTTLEQ